MARGPGTNGYRFIILLALALRATSGVASPTEEESLLEQQSSVDSDTEAEGDPSEQPRKRNLTAWNEYEGPWLTLRVGAMAIVDVNGVDQDKESVEQVGAVETDSELRTLRLMLRGSMGRSRRVSYFYAGEYNGLSREPEDSILRMTDLAFTVHFERLGDLTIGKTKEPISLARIMPGDGVLLMERATNDSLIPSRNTGLKLSNTAFDQRLTWQVGWFNSWFLDGESFSESDNQFVGRVSGTPVFQSGGSRLVHLAVAGRYAEAEDGVLRFRQPPEVNTAPDFVDTGTFEANSSTTLGLELGAVAGGWSVQGELLEMDVRSATAGNPNFSGWYLAASYFLTGDHRAYNRGGGFFYKVTPDRPLGEGPGAWDLVIRHSRIDLDDGAVSGGKFERWTVGANWFANREWRLEINLGRGTLDRFDTRGHSDFLQFRLQWMI